MINKFFYHLTVCLVGLCSLTYCSFDPKLEHLKFKVLVKDTKSETTIEDNRNSALYNLHCCKFRYREQFSSQWSNFTKFYSISKNNNKGEVRFSLDNSFLAGTQIVFEIICGQYAFPPSDQVTDAYCETTPPGFTPYSLSCGLTISQGAETLFEIAPEGAIQGNCATDPLNRSSNKG